MTTHLLTRPRTILGIGLLAAILAAGAYAFTASNTVPDTHAGSGTGNVSGYTVSNVDYTLAADPTKVQTLEFDLDAGAATTTVKVRLGSTGTWTTCPSDAAGHVTCDYSASPIDVQPIDQLDVVAVD